MATLNELSADLSDAVKAAVQGELRQILLALPGIVQTQSDGHNAKAISAIKGLVRNDQGVTNAVEMPVFDTMPIHFAGGGQVVATHPVLANDEGIILFVSRALDSWRQSGGVQTPIDARQHHASDAVYLGGIKSDPNTIKNVSQVAYHGRSIDGMVTHEVHPTNGITSKAVDPSDPQNPANNPNGDPFGAATIFHSFLAGASGLIQTAKDTINNHSFSLARLTGLLASVVSGQTASHLLQLTPQNGFFAFASNPSTNTSCSINALPTGVLQLLATNGISVPGGGIGAGTAAGGSGALAVSNGASSPPAGSFGEIVTSGFVTVSMPNGSDKNICSIPLTAGIWDVWATVYISDPGTGYITVVVTTLSGNASVMFYDLAVGLLPASPTSMYPVGRSTLNVAAAETFYLVGNIGASGATCGGIISARRVG